MKDVKKVYVLKNWFKSIFLQIYFDYIRDLLFHQSKKNKEWVLHNEIKFEENCFVTNEEIMSSLSYIFQELIMYGIRTPEEIEKEHALLKEALEKNEREKYIQILFETKQYDIEHQGIFSFSENWEYVNWSAEHGETLLQAFRTMILRIQEQKTFSLKHPSYLPDHFAFFLFLNVLASEGLHMDIPYMSHPLPGIGKSHTHLSITDPGRGHRQSTVLYPPFLKGNYVHVEHLERLRTTRKQIESYRIPNILDFALLRACVGDLAPVTTYIGRPTCEYEGHLDLLKAAHLTSAAISAFFALGAAEVKLSIEPLTIKEGIAYLCRLMTFREHPRQVISVAFNLNNEWVDDRKEGEPQIIKDKKEIGLLGIEVAIAAGWDKITWDGAGDVYPSVCVMEQIDHATALTLVHTAHEKGLTTYFSGGFVIGKGHIAMAVYTGVDGIGIGGAQVLRLMDKEGHEGPFLEENIAVINKERDDAEATIRGKSARLLACLDHLYFEGSLHHELESLRQSLFQEMLAVNEKALVKILESATQYHFPIGQDDPEEDFELLSCKRIAASGKNSISYKNCHDPEMGNQALEEIKQRVSHADSISKKERRLYYTDVLRSYRKNIGWNPAGGIVRTKFYELGPKKTPHLSATT